MKRWLVVALGVVLTVPLASAGWLMVRYRPKAMREDAGAVRLEIERLTYERDSLRARVFAAVARNALLARRPSGDVLIGIPTPFLDSLVHDIVAGWFHDVEVQLSGVVVHKAGDVHARLGMFGRRQVGTYDLNLTLDDVRGRLKAGVPKLTYGADQILVALPVRLTGGSGRATVSFQWDSRGVANAACGDLTTTKPVAGTVRPADYQVRGRIVLTAVDGAIVADPNFPELAMRLYINPSRQTLAELDQLIASKGGICGFALGKARVEDRILELVGKGFNIRVPQKFFRPVQLPIAVERSVPVKGQPLALTVSPTGLTVNADAVWLGAAVSVRPVRPSTP